MGFEVSFKDASLEKLEQDPKYTAGYDGAVVKAFRKRMQLVRAATDERDFSLMRSLNFERLKGKRQHQFSMRLNDQWRLILELETVGTTKMLLIVGIEDYH